MITDGQSVKITGSATRRGVKPEPTFVPFIITPTRIPPQILFKQVQNKVQSRNTTQSVSPSSAGFAWQTFVRINWHFPQFPLHAGNNELGARSLSLLNVLISPAITPSRVRSLSQIFISLSLIMSLLSQSASSPGP